VWKTELPAAGDIIYEEIVNLVTQAGKRLVAQHDPSRCSQGMKIFTVSPFVNR
jgi:hypothetical protein